MHAGTTPNPAQADAPKARAARLCWAVHDLLTLDAGLGRARKALAASGLPRQALAVAAARRLLRGVLNAVDVEATKAAALDEADAPDVIDLGVAR